MPIYPESKKRRRRKKKQEYKFLPQFCSPMTGVILMMHSSSKPCIYMSKLIQLLEYLGKHMMKIKSVIHLQRWHVIKIFVNWNVFSDFSKNYHPGIYKFGLTIIDVITYHPPLSVLDWVFVFNSEELKSGKFYFPLGLKQLHP
jgi:hypothetical protein